MRSPIGRPSWAALMIKSWSSGPSSSALNTDAVISESDCCSEIGAMRGLRSTLVL